MSTAPVLLLLVFDGALFLLAGLRAPREQRSESLLISALFLCSGMPALIYQVVWQRALFAIYGVNSQSVAVVVAAFMLGLGLGSLLGGRLSARYPQNGILIFGLAELGVALFGLASLRIFHWFAGFSAGAALPAVIAHSIVLLLIPTVLMGATLPLLVEQLVRSSGSVGASVSRLYFANTLGSAIACYLCAAFLLREFSRSGSVTIAACLNTLVGATAYLYARRKSSEDTVGAGSPEGDTKSAVPFSLGTGMVLACFGGFVALGFEIAWFRLFSVASSDRAPAFALLLATYLGGVAAGSHLSDVLARNWGGERIVWLVAVCLLLAGGLSVYLPSLVAILAALPQPLFWASGWRGGGSYLVAAPLFFLVAGMLGSVLPCVSRLSVPAGRKAGFQVSLIYAANIAGAVAGSLGIGFVLTQFLGLQRIALLLGSACVLCGLIVLLSSMRRGTRAPSWMFALALAAIAALPLSQHGYKLLYERIIFGDKPQAKVPFAQAVENRNGVISVLPDGAVFGSGVYDGHFKIDPSDDDNFIVRALALAAVHPAPKRVLIIGLASGSWAQTLIHHPAVERMDIVEINPGYLELIARYPIVSSLLSNPKAHIFVDDGRRWLIAHPEEKYDLIVANTTYHWRDHASTLLSVEFFRLMRPHLKPAGIYYFNTTESDETMATALHEFPYGLRILNFLAVSESPISFDENLWFSVLGRYEIDGHPLFSPADPRSLPTLARYRALADTLGGSPQFFGLESSDSLRARLGRQRIITDDNMGREWDPAVSISWR